MSSSPAAQSHLPPSVIFSLGSAPFTTDFLEDEIDPRESGASSQMVTTGLSSIESVLTTHGTYAGGGAEALTYVTGSYPLGITVHTNKYFDSSDLQFVPIDMVDSGTLFTGDAEVSDKLQHVFDRIASLSEIALEDEIPTSSASLGDLLSFLGTYPNFSVPSLYLLESGDYRAVWRGDEGQVGFQFLGNGLVQYVVLRTENDDVRPTYGVDDFRRTDSILSTLGLRHLVVER